MKKYSKNIALISLLALLFSLSSCKDKRISYVDMVKREKKEIKAYMDKNSISVRNDFPADLVTPEGVFVKIPDVEELYIRVVKKGDLSALQNGKTIVVSRFNVSSISPRQNSTWKIAGAEAGGTQPLPFIYFNKYDPQRNNLYIDPNAILEEENRAYLCRALLEAVHIAGMNSEVEIITSFRYGPSFTSSEGIPVVFEQVTFRPKM